MESMIQSEKDCREWDAKDRIKAREKMIKAGVEFYKFPPDMAKWFIDTAYNAAWEYQMKRFPDVTPKLRELLSKK
jgi:TRAP-type C4-dicarboxylate transport system substrate-binding protein